MGYMTLAQFRTEVQSAMGNRDFPSDRLDTWINLAYFDIAGAIDFESLDESQVFNTAIGDAGYAVPAGTVMVRAVVNDSTKTFLRWISKIEYFRLNRTQGGGPTTWTRHGDQVFIHPSPNAVWSFIMIVKKEPNPLAVPADKTVIPRTWDAAVSMLATSYGFLAVGENQAAGFWRNLATQYIQTRAVDGELVAGSPAILPQIQQQGGR